MVLERLVGPVPRSHFAEHHHLKRPFARAGGFREFADLGRDLAAQLGEEQFLDDFLAEPGRFRAAGDSA
jgi:hypothetical protein